MLSLVMSFMWNDCQKIICYNFSTNLITWYSTIPRSFSIGCLPFLTMLCFIFSKQQIWIWIKPVLNLITFPLEVQLIKEKNSGIRYLLQSCVCYENVCGFSLWQKMNLKYARCGMTASMLKRSKIALHHISSIRVT